MIRRGCSHCLGFPVIHFFFGLLLVIGNVKPSGLNELVYDENKKEEDDADELIFIYFILFSSFMMIACFQEILLVVGLL